MKKIILSASVLALLASSCNVPLAIMGLAGTSQSDNFYGEPEPEIPIDVWKEEFDAPDNVNQYIELKTDNTGPNGEIYFYVGEANNIRVVVPEGVDINQVTLETTAGTIERSADDPSLFLLRVKEPNLALEIKAEDKNSGGFGFLVGQTTLLTMPQACLNLTEEGTMDVETFKKQGQLMFRTSDNKQPQGLCLCAKFTLTRIAVDGKKETVLNSGDAFTANTKTLTAKAQKGDMYVFDEIMVSCPGYPQPKAARSLVYVLK